MNIKYVIALAPFMIASVYGKECVGKKTVFKCVTTNNKVIAVCGKGNQLFYRFGKKGRRPEKKIKTSLNHVDYKLWNGYGSAAKQSITFKDKGYSYRVFSKYDRLVNGKPTKRVDVDFDMVSSGGVAVKKGKKLINTVKCDDKKIIDHIEDYKSNKKKKKTATKVKRNSACKNTVFSCTTKYKRFIKVCKTPTNYIYQFGKVGKKPQITLKRRHNAVAKMPWNGKGSSITQSIGFANKQTIYSVFSSTQRKKNGKVSGGVLVQHAGKNKLIKCESGSMKAHISAEL